MIDGVDFDVFDVEVVLDGVDVVGANVDGGTINEGGGGGALPLWFLRRA